MRPLRTLPVRFLEVGYRPFFQFLASVQPPAARCRQATPRGGYFPTIAGGAAWIARVEGAEGQLNGAMTKNDQSWLQGFCRRRAMCAAHKGPVSHRYGPGLILHPILPFIEATAASSELTQPPVRNEPKPRQGNACSTQHKGSERTPHCYADLVTIS